AAKAGAAMAPRIVAPRKYLRIHLSLLAVGPCCACCCGSKLGSWVNEELHFDGRILSATRQTRLVVNPQNFVILCSCYVLLISVVCGHADGVESWARSDAQRHADALQPQGA